LEKKKKFELKREAKVEQKTHGRFPRQRKERGEKNLPSRSLFSYLFGTAIKGKGPGRECSIIGWEV